MFNYSNLFELLKQNGIRPTWLIEDGLISFETMRRLRNNQNVSLRTLDLISVYIGCEIWDLFTYEKQ